MSYFCRLFWLIYSEDLNDVTDDVWLANRTSFRVRSLGMEVRLIVANRTQIHAIVYKQKPSLLIPNQWILFAHSYWFVAPEIEKILIFAPLNIDEITVLGELLTLF